MRLGTCPGLLWAVLLCPSGLFICFLIICTKHLVCVCFDAYDAVYPSDTRVLRTGEASDFIEFLV